MPRTLGPKPQTLYVAPREGSTHHPRLGVSESSATPNESNGHAEVAPGVRGSNQNTVFEYHPVPSAPMVARTSIAPQPLPLNYYHFPQSVYQGLSYRLLDAKSRQTSRFLTYPQVSSHPPPRTPPFTLAPWHLTLSGSKVLSAPLFSKE